MVLGNRAMTASTREGREDKLEIRHGFRLNLESELKYMREPGNLFSLSRQGLASGVSFNLRHANRGYDRDMV